jgi:hypothetical protein
VGQCEGLCAFIPLRRARNIVRGEKGDRARWLRATNDATLRAPNYSPWRFELYDRTTKHNGASVPAVETSDPVPPEWCLRERPIPPERTLSRRRKSAACGTGRTSQDKAENPQA